MIRRTKGRMWVCACLLTVNLLFIWGNSLMPAEESGALSQWVFDLLRWLLPTTEPQQGHGLLRKLAHFSEFCALGLLLGWLFAMLRKKQWAFVMPSMACGCLTACVDETIQRFSPGRYPSIVDVGIDSAGAALGIVLLWAGYTVYKRKNQLINWRKTK